MVCTLMACYVLESSVEAVTNFHQGLGVVGANTSKRITPLSRATSADFWIK
jgi:hypothetical protein